MTKGERLALLVALDKRIGPELRLAKDEARQDLMESFSQDGTDRKALVVGEEKVGEVGISYSKASPYILVGSEAEAHAFLEEHELVEVSPKRGWEREFELVGGQVVYKATGEVVAWAGWQGRTPKTASVRGCSPEDVVRAFGGRLVGLDPTALIEGGAE